MKPRRSAMRATMPLGDFLVAYLQLAALPADALEPVRG